MEELANSTTARDGYKLEEVEEEKEKEQRKVILTKSGNWMWWLLASARLFRNQVGGAPSILESLFSSYRINL